MIIIPIAGTSADNTTRRVNPAIIGPGRTWEQFASDPNGDFQRATDALRQTGASCTMPVLHMPQGNDKRILNGAYCADAFWQCHDQYPALTDGFIAAFNHRSPAFYVGSPTYTQEYLEDSYAPYIACKPSLLILDHATSFYIGRRRLAALFMRHDIPIMIEGGDEVSIPTWRGLARVMLESRSQCVELADAVYIGSGDDASRIVAARAAIERNQQIAINWNDVKKYEAAGITLSQIEASGT